MTLRFDADGRTRLLIPMVLDIDPTGSLVDVQVDSTWHAAEWIGVPVERNGKWQQIARTTGYFAGPDAVAGGATVLALGPHRTKTRVSKAGDVLVARSTTIAVID
jgi:hypothetical protein